MVLETSAVVAIIRKESEREDYLRTLQEAPLLRMSAASFMEASIVLTGSQPYDSFGVLDTLLADLDVVIEEVTREDALIARAAFMSYGKGRSGKHGLNLGDLFAYALAKRFDEPLLFKGNDFALTDVKQVQAGTV